MILTKQVSGGCLKNKGEEQRVSVAIPFELYAKLANIPRLFAVSVTL